MSNGSTSKLSVRNERTQVAYVPYLTANSVYDGVTGAANLLFGIGSEIAAGSKVLIKPNFVAPFKNAVTDFDVIRAAVEQIKSLGCIPIIAESYRKSETSAEV